MTTTKGTDRPPPDLRETPRASRAHSRLERRDPARGPRPATTLTAAWYGSLALVTTLWAMGFLGMFTRPLQVPLVYGGDALSGGAQVKGTLENGWYERNPGLGAPFGQNLHDFPMADNMQFVLVRILGLFTDKWSVVYNLAYLSTYPLTALAAAWFIRVVGGSRLVAFVFGLLYAFTPYHFIHGQPHLALSMLFVVPLFAGLVMKAMGARDLWSRRVSASPWNPLAWLTPTTLGTLAIVVLTGSTSSYYAVFGLILMTFATGLIVLRRRWRQAVGAVLAMCSLIFVMLVNMAPDILYARSMPTSPAAFERQPLDSEIYALKLASLIFPVPWHRVDALSHFRLNYDGVFPNPGESPTLGVVAGLGFVFLLALPLVLALRRQPVAEDGPLGSTQRHLALLTLVAFLFGTLGGLGTVFALLVSADIRAWNRIVVYLALFGLAGAALLVDAMLTRFRSRTATDTGAAGSRRRSARGRLVMPVSVLGVAVVVLIGGVGLWDESAPPSWTSSSSNALEDWSNDEAYVREVEKVVPSGTQIFQLPVMSFPESPPIWEIHDYDPIRPYLHSRDLDWSYGGLKGRPSSDWQATIAVLPVLRMAVALAASGFGGIHVDRYGYPERDTGELEDYLQELVGQPVESPDGRWAFYDLTDLREEVERVYSSEELSEITRHVTKQPVFYWQQGFAGPPVPDGAGHLLLAGTSAQPRGVIDNPGGPIPMKLTFTIQAVEADSYPTEVEVTWPDGDTEVVSVDEDGTEVSRSWTARHGQQSLLVAGVDMRTVNLLDLALRDPALSFPLRGAAATLAAEHEQQRASEEASREDETAPASASSGAADGG